MDHFPPFIQNILDPFIPLYQQLEGFELWQNTGIDYLLVPVIFVASFIVSYIVKFVILGRMRDILPQKGSDITEPVLKRIRQLINFTTVFFVATYLSVQHLNMNAGTQLAVDVVILAALFWAVYRFISGMIDSGAEYRQQTTEDDQEHILSFITLVGKITAASIIFLLYLHALNVDVTGLAAGLGVAGITIAFALQNIVSDLFAAVAIYLDKPFEIGDFIVVNDKSGTVEKIGIRSTHLRSPDGPQIVVSNQNLTNSDITNYQKMDRRRVQQTIGVSAEAPIQQLRQLPEKFREIAASIDQVEVDQVWLKELGNFSWNYEIIYYVQDRSAATWREVQQELNFRVLELMEEEDIDLPYPIQEILLNGKDNIARPLEATAQALERQQSN